MGLYINGMEMPSKCIRCPVNLYGRCLVNDDKDVSKATADAVRDKECPLIEVPAQYGRLIDADALIDKILGMYAFDNSFRFCMKGILLSAPTVIPASEEAE